MDNYSKIYVKTYGAAPFNGNYIKQPELSHSWKGYFSKDDNGNIINNIKNNENNTTQNNPNNPNYIAVGSTQVKLTVPTNSRPESNLPFPNKENFERSFRGLPISTSNYSIGRYTGIYTSARGKSAGTTGPLNPIKHWRKQLIPTQGHITGKPSIDSVIWTPGGSTTLASNIDTSCYSTNSIHPTKGMLFQYIKNGFTDMDNCNCEKSNVIRNELSNFQPVYFNNPERIVRPRSSQTKLKKNYYTTGSAYLKSRVKLYEQNQLLSTVNQKQLKMNNEEPIKQNLPPSNNNWVYAENNTTEGSQAFYSTYSVSDPSACCFHNNLCQASITFKPNNPFYAVQGAVDSSTRILQAKYNAITKNNNNFTKNTSNIVPYLNNLGLNVYQEAGNPNSKVITLQGATPSKYRGDSYRGQSPYFIKSKYQRINACSNDTLNYQVSTHIRNKLNGIGNRQPSGGSGTVTTCFYNAIPVN